MAVLARISHQDSMIEHWLGHYWVVQNGARLDWLNSGGAPLLNTHDSESIRQKVGTLRRAWTQGRETLAAWDWEPTEFAQESRGRVESGHLRYVSVGFRVLERQRIEAGEYFGPFLITSWEPEELSLVAIPADRRAVILDVDYQLE